MTKYFGYDKVIREVDSKNIVSGIMNIKIKKFFYKARGFMVTPPLIVALLYPYPEEVRGTLYWIWGGVFVLLGLFIRIWAQEHLHYRLDPETTLTITGPYTIMRNPLYVANTSLCVGAAFSSKILWAVPLTLLWCMIVYSIVVRFEEHRLEKQYGESYLEFKNKTSRWKPRKSSFKDLEFINSYFLSSFTGEVHSVLVLLPFFIKDLYF
ncbi:MAG: methyltransferase family protein [Elusimicrobiota bacterium]